MLLRQVQARPLQGHRLRALRRRGHPLEGPPRAHGPHRPRRPGQPHLVLQGRPEPDRLPARHGSQGAREGPVLRRLDGDLGRRRGSRRATSSRSRARSTRCSTRYAAEKEERVLELKESLARREAYLESGKTGRDFSDEDHLWAETLEVNVAKLSDEEREKLLKDLRKSFQADIDDTEAYIEDAAERMRQVWELFKTMKPKDVVNDETTFRELKDRFGSPYGFGEYFRGGMGAEAVRDLLQQVDLDAEAADLQEQVKTAKGQKQARAVKRLKVVSAFIALRQQAGDDDPRGGAGDPAGAAPDGPARRWPLRHLGPQRPLPPRHQPQQPPQAAARPRRARDHRQQREADAAGGRRRAVRQRPPRPSGHRTGQPPAQVAQRHAQGQAGPVPPEPARQARRLLRAAR